MPPAATRQISVPVTDASELSPRGAAGVTAFNRMVDTKTLAEDIRAGRVIQGVDPKINTLESVDYRRYIKRVMAKAGLSDSQLGRQLASNVCGYVAALPYVPSQKEIVNKATKETEYDLQVQQLADAAEGQVRASTGTVATMTGPARALAKAALDLRLEDPDGTKGVAWVNDPLPAERPGAEPGRFDDEGYPTAVSPAEVQAAARTGVEVEPEEDALDAGGEFGGDAE